MTSALPIVPPPREGELLGSWIQRTASVYDLSAHQLLDQWLTPQQTVHPKPSLEARVVAAGAFTDLVGRMRATPEAIQAMLPHSVAWLVGCDTDAAVCTRCLLDDDLAGVPRIRRRPWAECWRVRCAKHGVLLVDMPEWRSSSVGPGHKVSGLQRNASGKVASIGGTQRPWNGRRRQPSVQVAINAVIQMEVTIGGALAGRRPHAASWGEISASEFLTVVQDVTTFVLSRFNPGGQRLFCAVEAFRYKDGTSMRCFERLRANLVDKPVRQPVLIGLAQAGDVGWRRCALYWARELMHARTARTWLRLPLRQDRQQRQKAALERQCDAGIEWLADRVNGWPELYREQRWRAWRPQKRGHCHF